MARPIYSCAGDPLPVQGFEQSGGGHRAGSTWSSAISFGCRPPALGRELDVAHDRA